MKTLSDDTLEQVAAFLKILGESNRLKIVRNLLGGEKTVTDIVKSTGCTQSNVSKHLSVLVGANILASRKEGASVYYRTADPNISLICESVCRSIAQRIVNSSTTLKNIKRGLVLSQ